MIAVAIVAGVSSTLSHRHSPRADIEHWVFDESSARVLRDPPPGGGESLLARFQSQSGQTAEVKLVQFRAMNTRLGSLLVGRTGWPELPDVVDLEIGSVGRYFRPPAEEIGLLPLNDLIARHGWAGRLLPSRLATWSKDGVIFGVPLDVHPVMIAYNDERFRLAGIDLSRCDTWAAFVDACRSAQQVWRARGERASALEMSTANASTLVVLLLQRGINLVDADGTIRLNDERTAQTLAHYCLMLAGPDAIGASTSGSDDAIGQDLASGRVNALILADWRLRSLMEYGDALAGKMRLMPLPRWPDATTRTSTFGGSMVGIPRDARDPELAWRYIEATCLSAEANTARSGQTYVVPAMPERWDGSPDVPDPFFGGQRVNALIRELAAKVPTRIVSPASTAAEVELSLALSDALAYAATHGEVGLLAHCQTLLNAAAARLHRQLAHARFDP